MTHLSRQGALYAKADASPVFSKDLSTLADKIGMVLEHLNRKSVWCQFLFQRNLSAQETIYSYWAVSFDGTLFVNGKNNGFTTNDWQEKHFLFIYLILFSFNQDKFCPWCLWIFPVWDKICKIKTNYPHLWSVGDDKTICLNIQLFC